MEDKLLTSTLLSLDFSVQVAQFDALVLGFRLAGGGNGRRTDETTGGVVMVGPGAERADEKINKS